MAGKMIRISADDGGDFAAYLALPQGGTGPGVVAIQEIFGVNAGMREICDNLAAAGFMALSPDLFWRQEPGVELTDQSEEHWQKAFQLYQGFDVEAGVRDIATSLAALRAMDGASGKVGAVGYCLGGLLAYLTACRTDADAVVGYYGVGIQERLGEATNIKRPLLLHVATGDEFVDAAAQSAMHEALDAHPLVTLYDYEGKDHAFARPNGMHYDPEAAELANGRTLALFKEQLGG